MVVFNLNRIELVGHSELLLHQWSTGTISESLDCIGLQKGVCEVILAISLRF